MGEASREAVAGALLHRLRIESGLSQRELGERCGISDRSVRGLESGAVRNPQRATLVRLAAALGLDAARRERLLGAWREQQLIRTVTSLLDQQGRSAPDEVLRHWARQEACVRQLLHWNRMRLGPDGSLRRIESRRCFVVVGEPIDRWIWADSLDSDTVPEGYPRIVRTEDCRLEGTWPFGADARLYELVFDHTLTAGETYSIGMEIAHAPDDFHGDATPETENLSVIRKVGPSLTSQVYFDTDRLPTAVWQVHRESIEAPETIVAPCRVSPFHALHLHLEHPGPGVHGLRWSWDTTEIPG